MSSKPRPPWPLTAAGMALAALFGSGCATSFAHTTPTTADRDRLWAVWTDVPGWPAWDTELASAELDGAFAAGVRGTLKPNDGPESGFTLKEVEPQGGYTYDVDMPLAHLRVERRAEPNPQGPGLEVTHRVSFQGPLGWLFAAFLKGRYEAALPGVMDKLIEAAEAEEAP